MLDLISSSSILTWLATRILDLWQDTAGRIFIVTALAYLGSYLIYGGYLAWFTGGFGGISFSLLEFNVFDILTIIPTAFLALINIFRSLFIAIFWAILKYIIVPIALGFIIASPGYWISVHFKVNVAFPSTLTELGFVLWSFGILPNIQTSNRDFSERNTWNKVYFVLRVLGSVIFLLGFFEALASGIHAYPIPQPVITPSFVGEIYGLTVIILVIFIPVALGLTTAQVAIEENVLNRVTKLVLKQPIPILGETYELVTNKAQQEKRDRLWLLRSTVPIEIQPEVYICCPEKCLYLVASFRSNTIFFTPEGDSLNKRGSTVIIANEYLQAIELQSRRKQGQIQEPFWQRVMW
jgi:hypothetical protein